MNKLKEVFNILIQKFMTKEVILYLVFGALTTLINIGSFHIFITYCHINTDFANALSILLAILFAYLTNRKLVFNSTASNKQEVFSEMKKFFSARFVTLLIEFWGVKLLVDVFHINELISKSITTIISVILNFFFSKFFAFKKDSKHC